MNGTYAPPRTFIRRGDFPTRVDGISGTVLNSHCKAIIGMRANKAVAAEMERAFFLTGWQMRSLVSMPSWGRTRNLPLIACGQAALLHNAVLAAALLFTTRGIRPPPLQLPWPTKTLAQTDFLHAQKPPDIELVLRLAFNPRCLCFWLFRPGKSQHKITAHTTTV